MEKYNNIEIPLNNPIIPHQGLNMSKFNNKEYFGWCQVWTIYLHELSFKGYELAVGGDVMENVRAFL